MPSKGSSTKSADMVKLEPMMRLVLHCIDRVRRFKLGKEVGCYVNKSCFSKLFLKSCGKAVCFLSSLFLSMASDVSSRVTTLLSKQPSSSYPQFIHQFI